MHAFIQLIQDHADPVVAAVFLLLLIMSFLSWAVGFWKLADWLLQRWMLRRFIRRYGLQLLQQPLPQPPRNSLLASLLTQLQQASAQIKPLPVELQAEATNVLLRQALDVQRLRMERGLTLLASIGSSAPFIGLFGTVWGIYLALHEIAVQQSASIAVVSGPMGEALLATAAGLFAAIPAVLAYNAFLRLNRIQMQDVRHVAEQVQFALINQQPAGAA